LLISRKLLRKAKSCIAFGAKTKQSMCGMNWALNPFPMDVAGVLVSACCELFLEYWFENLFEDGDSHI
jgi:hypothetical protein